MVEEKWRIHILEYLKIRSNARNKQFLRKLSKNYLTEHYQSTGIFATQPDYGPSA